MFKSNFFSMAKSCMSASTSICLKEDLEKIFDNEGVKEICSQVAELRGRTAESDEEKRANKEAADRLKKTLPVLMPHAFFQNDGRRCNENAQESPWVSMDYDNLSDPREVWEQIQEKVMALSCPLAFVSPSGCGLKFIVALPMGMNREQAQDWIAHYLEMPDYDHTHDLARCCFLVGRDNLLHYNPQLLFSTAIELPEGLEKYEEPAAHEEKPKRYAPEDGEVTDYEEVGEATPENCQVSSEETGEPNYLGIPYSRIIDKFWELHNAGRTPVVSNRNALTYDLAYHLRAIAGFNRELLDKIIPCYDGFTEAEKMKCIESALSRPVSGISEKMGKVLAALKQEHLFDPEIVKAIEEVEEVNANYDIEQIKTAFAQKGARVKGMPRHENGKLPAGLRHCLENLPGNLAMPVIVGTAPLFGVLGSEIRLKNEGKARALNLNTYIVGGAGSGKSKFDDLVEQWMKPWREEQKAEEAKDEEYEEERRQKKNAKEQPKDPCAQVLELSPRTSTAKALRRLKNAKGRMCFTFAQEIDMSSASSGQSWNKDLGVIARCAYDESCYSTDYQNSETGRIVIPHVRWNRMMCGTPDALYRALRNYTDGEITRVGIAAMPCNSFTPYEKIESRSLKTQQEMEQMAYLLMKMKGEVSLPILEQKGHDWQERIRIEAMYADDKVLADQRFRIPTTALRITTGYMALHCIWWLIEQLDKRKGDLPAWAHGCETAERYLEQHSDAAELWIPMLQNEAWVRFFETLCDYMIRTVMTYFRDRISAAYNKDNYVVTDQITSTDKSGRNRNIFEALPERFTVEQALVARGDNNPNANRCMLKHWKRQGLVKSPEKGLYEKVA